MLMTDVMADISFYHLTSTSLDEALPKLLEKALQGGFRILVRVTDADEAERVNSLLWNYSPDSFLPHGTVRDGFAQHQPAFITPEEENPNNASLLVVTNGIEPSSLEGYMRVLDIFNGADESQLASARMRWKSYSNASHALSYIKQSATGGWEKQNL